MGSGWSIVALVAAFGIAVAVVRQRYFSEGRPAKTFYEAQVKPRLQWFVKAMFFVTVAVWLVIWATADEADRSRLTSDLKTYLKDAGFAPPEEEGEGTDAKAGTEAEGKAGAGADNGAR